MSAWARICGTRDRSPRVALDPADDPGSALRSVRDDETIMAEILFYHLQQQPLESVLPTLLQKTLERGWRAVIQVTTEERLSALDDHLWTFSDESFLPHGTDREAHAPDQPILITLSADNPNGAAIRFLTEGADLPQDIASYQRLAILFDGNDVQALAMARDQWRAVKEGGHEATYWQQDERGRWQRKA